jgi:hypothetical protein
VVVAINGVALEEGRGGRGLRWRCAGDAGIVAQGRIGGPLERRWH